MVSSSVSVAYLRDRGVAAEEREGRRPALDEGIFGGEPGAATRTSATTCCMAVSKLGSLPSMATAYFLETLEGEGSLTDPVAIRTWLRDRLVTHYDEMDILYHIDVSDDERALHAHYIVTAVFEEDGTGPFIDVHRPGYALEEVLGLDQNGSALPETTGTLGGARRRYALCADDRIPPLTTPTAIRAWIRERLADPESDPDRQYTLTVWEDGHAPAKYGVYNNFTPAGEPLRVGVSRLAFTLEGVLGLDEEGCPPPKTGPGAWGNIAAGGLDLEDDT
jgi:hypothetical protein